MSDRLSLDQIDAKLAAKEDLTPPGAPDMLTSPDAEKARARELAALGEDDRRRLTQEIERPAGVQMDVDLSEEPDAEADDIVLGEPSADEPSEQLTPEQQADKAFESTQERVRTTRAQLETRAQVLQANLAQINQMELSGQYDPQTAHAMRLQAQQEAQKLQQASLQWEQDHNEYMAEFTQRFESRLCKAVPKWADLKVRRAEMQFMLDRAMSEGMSREAFLALSPERLAKRRNSLLAEKRQQMKAKKAQNKQVKRVVRPEDKLKQDIYRTLGVEAPKPTPKAEPTGLQAPNMSLKEYERKLVKAGVRQRDAKQTALSTYQFNTPVGGK